MHLPNKTVDILDLQKAVLETWKENWYSSYCMYTAAPTPSILQQHKQLTV